MRELEQQHAETCELAYIGSLGDIVLGQVRPGVERRWIDASDIAYGFMAGSPRGISSTGELLVANGIAYAKSTDITDDHYYDVITGKQFVTQGCFCIPHHARAGWQLKWEGKVTVWESFCKQLYQELHTPFAMAGLVTFEAMQGVAISTAPTFDEDMSLAKERYLCFPPVVEEGGMGLVVGLVADFTDQSQVKVNRELQPILCGDPLNPPSDFAVHFHLLTLTEEVNSVDEVSPVIVDNVLHLMGDSTLTAIDTQLFPIGSLKPLFPEPATIAH
jgi:hypothetical protein